LVLDGLSGSLLRNFFSDTLLVLSSEKNGPSNSSWVLSLVEEGCRLRVLESENLGVTSDEEGTSTWVDLSTGKGVNFDLHCMLMFVGCLQELSKEPLKWIPQQLINVYRRGPVIWYYLHQYEQSVPEPLRAPARTGNLPQPTLGGSPQASSSRGSERAGQTVNCNVDQ
jgi:hypothetical protein